MKRTLLVIFSTSTMLGFVACNSDTKTTRTNETANDAKVKSVTAPVDPETQKVEELEKLTPVGLDELTPWLPDELNGIKRSNLTMSTDRGYAVAHADYEKNSKTDMRVTVYDCAGEAGANLYKVTYANKMNQLQESGEGYTKTTNFMGEKAIEHHEINNNITTLTYLANNHILVVVSARNFDPEKVKEAAQKLGTQAL